MRVSEIDENLKKINLDFDFGCHEGNSVVVQKLWNTIGEFQHYISVNLAFIPNYGERYRYGEKISTAFVESSVNEVISKRMVKKQQMRWTKREPTCCSKCVCPTNR